jgi:ribose transport system permease protein
MESIEMPQNSAIAVKSLTRASSAVAVRAIFGNGAAIAAILYLVMFVLYLALLPGARSYSHFQDQLANSLPLVLAAVGGTFVVLTRGFDLSVAGVVSLANVLVATYSMKGTGGILLAALMVCAVGLIVGAVNGILIAYLRLQPIACTLATMIITSGIALLIMDAPGGNVPSAIGNLLFERFGPISMPMITLGLVILVWAVIKRTDWGVGLYAVGADETASHLAGIATAGVKVRAYCVAGMFYGLAGLALSSVTVSGDPTAGNSFLLQVFAAIAIGGTSFAGGRGGVVGTILGALVLMLVQKLLFSLGVSSFYTGIGQGVLMIAAVLVGAFSAHIANSNTR